MAQHWIAGAIKHPGALHRELGVPEGKKIPAKKLAPRRATNPHGNPGFHPSTKGFHHEGSTHTSKDR